MQSIWFRFNANLSALSTFVDKVTVYADQEDHYQISFIAQKLANLFKDDFASVEKGLMQYIDISNNSDLEPRYEDNPDIKAMMDDIGNGKFLEYLQNWIKDHPRKESKLIEILNTMKEPKATNGVILRRGAFIMLVSFFETLIIDLLEFAHQQEVSNESNGFSQVNNRLVEDLRRLIDHGGFFTRIDYLPQLGINMTSLDPYKNTVFEITHRRNIFTHNEGIIDDNYMKKIALEKIKPGFATGRQLRISDKYLRDSMDVIYLYGCILYQRCYRTWVNGKDGQADEQLVQALFSLLKQNRNHLVISIADYISDIGIENTKNEKYQVIVINKAIAMRETGYPQKNILSFVHSEIIKSETRIIEVAINILRNDYSGALLLLRKMKKNGELKFLLKDWPLFKPVKLDPRFKPFLNDNN